MIQKLIGLGIIMVGLIPMLILGDGTFSLIAFLLGGFLMVTKDDCLI